MIKDDLSDQSLSSSSSEGQ